jgi:hypothetical protein
VPESWDDVKRTCMHGVREGLDDHTCVECQVIAFRIGLKPIAGGYLFLNEPSEEERLWMLCEYGVRDGYEHRLNRQISAVLVRKALFDWWT